MMSADRVDAAEDVRIERRLVEDVVSDPLAARDPPRPLVVRARIAHQQREKRRAAHLPEVRQPHGQRGHEDREVSRQESGMLADIESPTHLTAQHRMITKPRNHETTKLKTFFSCFRGFVVSCALPLPLCFAAAPASAQPRLTFTRDIAPIVWARCATCHRPDEIGPFNLITYDDVRRRATQIADVTSRRVMPPWKPEPGKGDFEGERRLTAVELSRIQQWIRDGALQGDPSDLPPPPIATTTTGGWRLGAPDLVVAMPQPYVVKAD